MPPTVQNLTDIISGLNGIYDPQRQSVNSQIGTTQDQATAAETGLGAAKDAAFGNITNNAQAKGMLFSGFTPDQQAKYTASTYLPALVNLHAKTQDNIAKLQNSIIQLNAQQQTQATGIQNQQKTDLNNYNIAQQQAEQARQKLAQELAIAQMNAQSRVDAAQISASSRGNSGPTAAQIKQQDMSTIANTLNSKKGRDGHVSQETWNAALDAWTQAGYGASEFVKNNMQYINQKYGGYHGFR